MIVAEYLERGDLYQLVHEHNTKLDLPKQLKITCGVARGLAYLHQCAPVIIHRDLSSKNVLITHDTNVKLCDFGLSRFRQGVSVVQRRRAGNMRWLAPELFRGESFDESVDIYSMGVILYEVFAKKLPWLAYHDKDLHEAKKEKKLTIPPPTGVQGRRGPAFELASRCCDNDPKNRPTASEALDALSAIGS
mmetsp:Transcript_49783/g.117036  ORF Transcript_49783/g.117036 Transcript_49783/m.117036 type:complete len:191 (-) Transcript_49783:93-665(-)